MKNTHMYKKMTSMENKIASTLSWYCMECGIHQGGSLSLAKYTVFKNAVLSLLEDSGLGSSIHGIPTNPVSYADVCTCTEQT